MFCELSIVLKGRIAVFTPAHVLSCPGVNVKANPDEGLWRGCVAGADTSPALGDFHRVHARPALSLP